MNEPLAAFVTATRACVDDALERINARYAKAIRMRVLEERSFERLGGTETLTIDARLLALTNADLGRLVTAGRFREDLFFRLNVLTIRVPPLRERPGDIAALTDHLLGRLAAVHGRPGTRLTEPVRRMLASRRLAPRSRAIT